MPSIAERLERIHQGREPERLRLKLARMAESPLAFLRGSPALFYGDWPRRDSLHRAPRAWLCGDLHLENFGTYRADNGLTYFDINDFDEACRGPLTWDLVRFLVSVVLEGRRRGLARGPLKSLVDGLLDTYAAQLATGKARWIERDTADGLIRELFDQLAPKKRAVLLKKRTESGGSRLRIDGEKALPLLAGHAREIEKFAARQLPDLRLLDAARRIAGNSSLGWPRFVLLAETAGGERRLLDLKFAPASAPVEIQRVKQPAWKSEAHRVAGAQMMLQAIPHALLRAVMWKGDPFILRELLPQEDRVKVSRASDAEFERFVGTLAEAIAWAHLRASGRRGAANADELGDYAHQTEWRSAARRHAFEYAPKVEADWREFSAAVRSSS